MTDPKKDAAHLALTLIQRFVGNQPDALERMQQQVQAELDFAESNATRLRAELDAINELFRLTEEAERSEATLEPRPQLGLFPPMPLRKAIITVLESRPGYWGRDELMHELQRRTWAPGGRNPRNTLTTRLAEMANEGQIERMGDGFGIRQREEVPAV